MHDFLRALAVPGVVLIGTALYWFHVTDAPSVARRVPAGVIVFILAMMAIVVVREYLVHVARRPSGAPAPEPVSPLVWLRTWWRQIAMVVLSVAYFAGFSTLGFNLCNFLFLVLALPLAGLGRGRRLPLALAATVSVAFVVSAVFHFLAAIMNFNVPSGVLPS